MTTLAEAARRWALEDPDDATAAELLELADRGDDGELAEVMGAPLEFGTAGIRGRVGPGPSRMNRAVVIRTTRGLADFLIDRCEGVPDGPVIVGFDARPTSRQFAEDTVGVLAAAGIRVLYFPEFSPTPLVAFSAKHLGAEAAVVVTASHNPPQDNGYKVYDRNAAQIISPTDTAISDAIARVGPANEVPRVADAFTTDDDSFQPVPESILDAYWAEVDATRPVRPGNTVRIVYTPLHGVGGRTMLDIFGRTSHDHVTPVAEQFEPDGRFPTVTFPNPEEPGALDLALAEGDRNGAAIVMANDPDADRLAAALPTPGSWRLLTGNELGVLLGAYLLGNWSGPGRAITACSVVSSPMLGMMATRHGAIHLTTLTGFKWIANAAMATEAKGEGRFLFGYEEALGYTVGRTVRDKDGIAAALLLADLAAIESSRGRTLLDGLADLWEEYGIWVSSQSSIVRPGESGAAELVSAVDHIASNPPNEVLGQPVTSLTDYRVGAEDRPPWLGAQDLVELSLGDSGRILVRPSGTEPKLKIYVDLREPGSGGEVHARRDDLLERSRQVSAAVAASLVDFIEGS